MAKKKRQSIAVVHEGYREGYFIDHIAQFNPSVHVNLYPCYGISATNVLNNAFKRSDCGLRVVAFFDEDFEHIEQRKIEEETLTILESRWGLRDTSLLDIPYRRLQEYNTKNKNPVLAVSWPNSIEGLILSLIDTPEENIQNRSTADLKSMLETLVEQTALTSGDSTLIESFDKKIAKYDVTLTELAQDASNYKEEFRYYSGKKQELVTKKNSVRFKRFLIINISLESLRNKRNVIPTIDILLKELGL